MKAIHIVVHEGLIQAIYTNGIGDAEVIIYDLDTEDNEEYDTLLTALTEVRKSEAKKVY
jgi:hypothetical protein